jgi:hypothetical protein
MALSQECRSLAMATSFLATLLSAFLWPITGMCALVPARQPIQHLRLVRPNSNSRRRAQFSEWNITGASADPQELKRACRRDPHGTESSLHPLSSYFSIKSDWSGRAMAREGLRMMPTFPSLKCRTAGYPQYGFKPGPPSTAKEDGPQERKAIPLRVAIPGKGESHRRSSLFRLSYETTGGIPNSSPISLSHCPLAVLLPSVRSSVQLIGERHIRA